MAPSGALAMFTVSASSSQSAEVVWNLSQIETPSESATSSASALCSRGGDEGPRGTGAGRGGAWRRTVGG